MTRLKLRSLSCLIAVIMSVCSCKEVKSNSPIHESRHWVEIRRADGERLYVDSINSETVMQPVDSSNSSTVFVSFLIGLSKEKIETDEKKYQDFQKYFQYDIDKDWTAIAGADSLHAVFYSPRVKRSRQIDEGILVFEVPKTKQIDTLVFQDKDQLWETQKIVLR